MEMGVVKYNSSISYSAELILFHMILYFNEEIGQNHQPDISHFDLAFRHFGSMFNL